MSCAEFVRWAESDVAHQCYVSWDFPGPDDIPNDGLDRLAEDIPSPAEFAINETESGTPNSAVWMGARGVVAQSHYDIQHNIFAQLRREDLCGRAALGGARVPPLPGGARALAPVAAGGAADDGGAAARGPPATGRRAVSAAALAAPRHRRRRALRLGQPLPGQPRERRRARSSAPGCRRRCANRARTTCRFPAGSRSSRSGSFLLHRACGGAVGNGRRRRRRRRRDVLRPHLESRFGLLHERIGCASWTPSLCPPRAELSPSLVDEARAHAEAAAAALDEWPGRPLRRPPRGRELRRRRRRGRRRGAATAATATRRADGKGCRGRAAAVRLPEMPRARRQSVGNVDFSSD